MKNTNRKKKIKNKPNENMVSELNQFASRGISSEPTEMQIISPTTVSESEDSKEYQKDINDAVRAIFNHYESKEFIPLEDYLSEIPVNSLESKVGYSSLIRQMHQAYVRNLDFYRSNAGGALSIEDARKKAFHSCTNKDEALKIFDMLMKLPLECLEFRDLEELHSFAPRAAEMFWERAKLEGRAEFESGHLAANITFPIGYMKQLWNIARYLGVRESFIDDWQPKGGIEISLIDMLAQSYFQWQYWLEQTVKRSQTRERETHPDYSRWLAEREIEFKANGWTDGYWNRPYVSEQQAIEHAVQMADRFNRIFMRTLRQLRDLRRYSLPVTINNPNQVNIATDGGQQVNVSTSSANKINGITDK